MDLVKSSELLQWVEANCDPYVFEVVPRGKVRMTTRDKWWKRNLHHPNREYRKRAEFIAEYYKYKDAIIAYSLKNHYRQDDYCFLHALLPLPPSISKKEKERRLALGAHQQKPDADNILKGFLDALAKKDEHVYVNFIIKSWTEGPGKIIAYKLR